MLDYILKAHWKEPHLDLELESGILVEMLSNSELDVLSKFKDI